MVGAGFLLYPTDVDVTIYKMMMSMIRQDPVMAMSRRDPYWARRMVKIECGWILRTDLEAISPNVPML
jgi:hypothetical protein